jgi:hypothetical protein
MSARDGDQIPDSMVCYSYTAARRHPLVIGKIGGFVRPSPLSPAQIATLLGSFSLLLVSRGLWGMFLPGIVRLFLLVTGPCGLTWAVRHLRMEGRSPIKMLLGQLSYWSAPRHGWVRGRGQWLRPRPIRVAQRIVVVPAAAPPARRKARAPVPVPAIQRPRWACLDTGEGLG